MTRSTALRSGFLFALIAFVAAGLGLGSQAPVAEILFLVAGALAVVTLSFAALTAPSPALRPVQARRARR